MAKEKVTRISVPTTSPKTKKSTDTATAKDQKVKSPRKNPLGAFFGYFSGAWRELRQVRWPNRSMTWSYTVAVIIFAIVMAIFIILLDLGLNELSRRILA